MVVKNKKRDKSAKVRIKVDESLARIESINESEIELHRNGDLGQNSNSNQII